MLCPPGNNLSARSSAQARFCSSSSERLPQGCAGLVSSVGKQSPPRSGSRHPGCQGQAPAPIRRSVYVPLGVRPESRQIVCREAWAGGRTAPQPISDGPSAYLAVRRTLFTASSDLCVNRAVSSTFTFVAPASRSRISSLATSTRSSWLHRAFLTFGTCKRWYSRACAFLSCGAAGPYWN